jgi:hypothetical protein
MQALELLVKMGSLSHLLSYTLSLLILQETPTVQPLLARVPGVAALVRIAPWIARHASEHVGTALAVPLHPDVAAAAAAAAADSNVGADADADPPTALAAWGPYVYLAQGATLLQVRALSAMVSLGLEPCPHAAVHTQVGSGFGCTVPGRLYRTARPAALADGDSGAPWLAVVHELLFCGRAHSAVVEVRALPSLARIATVSWPTPATADRSPVWVLSDGRCLVRMRGIFAAEGSPAAIGWVVETYTASPALALVRTATIAPDVNLAASWTGASWHMWTDGATVSLAAVQTDRATPPHVADRRLRNAPIVDFLDSVDAFPRCVPHCIHHAAAA